jgi:HSP20 family protein
MVEKPHFSGWWPDVFEPFRQAGERVAEWFSPRSDAASADGGYEINVELPGVSRDDIDIELHDGVMTVRGEKKSERKEEGEGYFFSERQYGRFQRTFRLPADAAEEGIGAEFRDGVLRITVPRQAPEQPKAKKISVKGG